MQKKLEFMVFVNEVLTARCNQECKPQCSFTEYRIKPRLALFPSRSAYAHSWGLADKSLENVSLNYWRESGYEIRMKFDSMLETEIVKSRKYSFLDTLGAFGGLGGFLLGASAISLVEMFFLVFDMVEACRLGITI